jgi:hypothetical protein
MNRITTAQHTFVHILHGIVFVIGWILSPLTWWNDLFVNVPIAYLLAQETDRVFPGFFSWTFVFAYWLTNVAGFLLMHLSASQYYQAPNSRTSVVKLLLTSLAYTLLIILLARFQFITSPFAYLKQLQGP